MNYHPPPLFNQGTSARVKVMCFSLLAILLLVIDARLHTLTAVRQMMSSVLYPIQMLSLMPRDALYNVGDYFTQLSTLKRENAEFERAQLAQVLEVQQGRQLQQENAQLRLLLNASEQRSVRSIMASILYDARDSFNRRIIVDRGTNHGVTAGQPVMDGQGIVGQVTRVAAHTSEVTLLTDKDQVIPVQVQRNGLRGVLYGKGQLSNLEMRLSGNVDIQVGDLLVTSGIDGIYPTGLSVARVASIQPDATATFQRVACVPLAKLDHHEGVLILFMDRKIQARPGEEEKEKSKPKKINRRVTRDGPVSAGKDGQVQNKPAKEMQP